MVTLMLSAEEQQTLVDVLECSISEIHTEIVHTDRCDFKELLKNRKQVMLGLLADLKAPATASAA